MGRKTDLKPEKKQRIAELLSHGKTRLDISKLIRQNHRTVKRFIENSNKVRGRSDKGKFQKISRREISSVKKTLSKNPYSTSAKIFHEAGVPLRSRAGRCNFENVLFTDESRATLEGNKVATRQSRCNDLGGNN